MAIGERAAAHAALGDVRRVAIVDGLASGDLTVTEIAGLVDLPGNLLAHHLDVLVGAGLIERRVSEGDHRRRYVSLVWDRLPVSPLHPQVTVATVVFVCTHNSARSQFAAALCADRLDVPTWSAGSRPAARVHPGAIEVASEFGVDLTGAEPGGYDRLPAEPDLVVSVCDRARESGLPHGRRMVHWSVPDPVASGTLRSFRAAFTEISRRLDRLTAAARREEP